MNDCIYDILNTIDISLYSGGSYSSCIATNISNSGNYNWSIPPSLNESSTGSGGTTPWS